MTQTRRGPEGLDFTTDPSPMDIEAVAKMVEMVDRVLTGKALAWSNDGFTVRNNLAKGCEAQIYLYGFKIAEIRRNYETGEHHGTFFLRGTFKNFTRYTHKQLNIAFGTPVPPREIPPAWAYYGSGTRRMDF